MLTASYSSALATHSAAAPAIPESARYFASANGISLHRAFTDQKGSCDAMRSNHFAISPLSPPPTTMMSGSNRSTTLPNQHRENVRGLAQYLRRQRIALFPSLRQRLTPDVLDLAAR